MSEIQRYWSDCELPDLLPADDDGHAYVLFAAHEQAIAAAVAAERERCRQDEVKPVIAALEREKAWHISAADKARDDGLHCVQFKSFSDACFKDEAVYRKRAALLEASIAAVRAAQEQADEAASVRDVVCNPGKRIPGAKKFCRILLTEYGLVR